MPTVAIMHLGSGMSIIAIIMNVIILRSLPLQERNRIMVCEQLKTCDYMRQLSGIDPFSARMIRTMNCWHIRCGCEKDCIHLASETGQALGMLTPKLRYQGKDNRPPTEEVRDV